MYDFWQQVAAKLGSGQRVFLALVAANTEHSSGTAGARLMVAEDGTMCGTIGGGVMEQNVIRQAKEALASGRFAPTIRTLHHDTCGNNTPSGLICAGSQTNLYYLACPVDDLATVQKVARLVAQDKEAMLTISGAGMAVRELGQAPLGANGFDTHAPAIALDMANETEWQYREHLMNRKRVAIIGGGHCALALSQVMKLLGYEIFVYDTRESVPTLEANTFARAVTVVDDYHKVANHIRYPELTFVIVMTPDYLSDARGLQCLLLGPFPFVGLMGSRAKIDRVVNELRLAEVPSDRLDRLYAPVGLQIDSHTPEEIAISIAAQIIKERGLGMSFTL